MGEPRSVSMTAYYGCMHAFVNVFTGEMAMARDLAARLEGQGPLRAFGWQVALDRARGRATRAAERWKTLNERFDGKVNPDAFERRVYGQNPASTTKAAQTARELVGRLGAFNRFIDGLQAYRAEDVRRICGMADEMTQAVAEDSKASSLVAAYLGRGAPDAEKGPPKTGQVPGGEGREAVSAYFEAFLRAQDGFRAGLEG